MDKLEKLKSGAKEITMTDAEKQEKRTMALFKDKAVNMDPEDAIEVD